MPEFMHEVVAKRNHTQAHNFPPQYSHIYGMVYMQTEYAHLAWSDADVIQNIRTWWDNATYTLMRGIFTPIDCNHRWLLQLGISSRVRYIYKCINCETNQVQNIGEE